TGVGVLLPMLSSHTLDPDYFADFLMGIGLAGAPGYEACAYAGIQRLASDAIWRIDIASGRQFREPCWNWRHHVVDPGTESLEELAQEFSRLLGAAVGER